MIELKNNYEYYARTIHGAPATTAIILKIKRKLFAYNVSPNKEEMVKIEIIQNCIVM